MREIPGNARYSKKCETFQNMWNITEDVKHSRKCETFLEMRQIPQNVKHSRKCETFLEMRDIPENVKHSRKCEALLEMRDIPENVKHSRKCETLQKMWNIPEIARYYRKCETFQEMWDIPGNVRHSRKFKTVQGMWDDSSNAVPTRLCLTCAADLGTRLKKIIGSFLIHKTSHESLSEYSTCCRRIYQFTWGELKIRDNWHIIFKTPSRKATSVFIVPSNQVGSYHRRHRVASVLMTSLDYNLSYGWGLAKIFSLSTQSILKRLSRNCVTIFI